MNDLEVCNWALCKLGQRPLASLEADSLKAQCCRLLFPPGHRSLLRSFAWSFATSSTCLSPLTSECYTEVRYGLPPRCLKVLKIGEEGVLKGDCIVVKDSAHRLLLIDYIEEVSLSLCDPLYQEALAFKVASELCPLFF